MLLETSHNHYVADLPTSSFSIHGIISSNVYNIYLPMKNSLSSHSSFQKNYSVFKCLLLVFYFQTSKTNFKNTGDFR